MPHLGKGIKHAENKITVPHPYIGKYGPFKKPGFIHFFRLKNLRKKTSNTNR